MTWLNDALGFLPIARIRLPSNLYYAMLAVRVSGKMVQENANNQTEVKWTFPHYVGINCMHGIEATQTEAEQKYKNADDQYTPRNKNQLKTLSKAVQHAASKCRTGVKLFLGLFYSLILFLTYIRNQPFEQFILSHILCCPLNLSLCLAHYCWTISWMLSIFSSRQS